MILMVSKKNSQNQQIVEYFVFLYQTVRGSNPKYTFVNIAMVHHHSLHGTLPV